MLSLTKAKYKLNQGPWTDILQPKEVGRAQCSLLAGMGGEQLLVVQSECTWLLLLELPVLQGWDDGVVEDTMSETWWWAIANGPLLLWCWPSARLRRNGQKCLV